MTEKMKPFKYPQEIKGLIFSTMGLVLLLSIASYNPRDPSFTHFVAEPDKIHNLIGTFGSYTADTLIRLFGISSLLLPMASFIVAYRYFATREYTITPTAVLCYTGFIIALSTFTSQITESVYIYDTKIQTGGWLGHLTKNFLETYFNPVGCALISTVFLLLCILSVFELSLTHLFKRALMGLKNTMRSRQSITEKTPVQITTYLDSEVPQGLENEQITELEELKTEANFQKISGKNGTAYTFPSFTLLDDPGKREIRVRKESLFTNARILEQKLADFGVIGKVVEIHPGPVITMYELEPAPGVKINRITSLSDDLALALKATSIRMIVPLPGKSAIGIEIPNPQREQVRLKTTLDSEAFRNTSFKIPIALGVDIVGNPVITDLTRMPHLLIAGTTGSGKSVSLNAMILSILFKARPDDVKLILIDPKRLEFSLYEGIPHLLHPVVLDPKKAANVLRWAVEEMERRYRIMGELGVKSIDNYNKSTEKGLAEQKPLPYIVIIIDELADLMLVAQRNVEESLARISQMARASGIHLIIATQRPSVDVITGVIKANFPTRISFQVSSKVDSRTILDQLGAETLLGDGDMLFMPPGTSKLVRIHGPYVSDSEILKVVDFVKSQANPSYDESILLWEEEKTSRENEEYDEKYDAAVSLVCELGQASISLIQRYLKIGYNRAARIIERMEAEGIVGPSDGVKPRKVLIQRKPGHPH